MTPLLAIEDLHVSFSTRRGPVEAVRGVSLTLAAGETLGIVGESGSGKSVTAFAVTRLLDAAGRITGGRILFRGEDIAKASRKQLRALHGEAISMIFQNPRAALNPIRTVGLQIADALRHPTRLLRADLDRIQGRTQGRLLIAAAGGNLPHEALRALALSQYTRSLGYVPAHD